MDFERYLKARYAPGTVNRYLREIKRFFFSIEKKEGSAEQASYSEVMAYLGDLRKTQKNIRPSLAAIKVYYDYLLSIDQRKDNPARSIILRDKGSRDIQLQDLFKAKELECLLDTPVRFQLLKHRNLFIISLLLYQGLTSADIVGLTLDNVNLEAGTIYIKAGRKTNARTLKLQSKQVFWLMKYLHEDRDKLLAKGDLVCVNNQVNNLLISHRGAVGNGESIGYLLERKRGLFPDRILNAKTIRQSVITNLLASGKDLRIVQAFAGHKYPSSTERYKQTSIEALKTQVLKHHPLQ